MVSLRILFKLMIFMPLFGSAAFCQDVEVGVFGGGSYYLGELNPGRQFFFTKPAFGISGRYVYDKRWSAKINGLMGKLAGDDAVSGVDTNRNLRFQSSFTEISMQAEFNFFNYFTGSARNYFTPYLYAGPAVFYFNPKTPYNGEMVALSGFHTEGPDKSYSRLAFAAMFGLGFKYSINSRLALNLEWGMRKTYTDYIDDISTTYYIDFDNSATPIGTAEILSDPSPVKHKPGMHRGNPENNDWYSIAGITVIYRFTIGEKSTCSDFEKSKNK